jgi:natural product biosynthesis luciferase-like monooxygenase protein
VSVVDLLTRLRAADVDLWVDEDRLKFSAPPGALTPELRAAIGEHKAEVMRLLKRSATAPPILAGRHDGPVALSFPQRRMWFFEQVHPGTPTYHMATAWRIRGDLDVALLESSFNTIARRHEMLRTRFALQDDEPVQIVEDRVTIPLPVIDIDAADLAGRIAGEAARPFDLSMLPLLRTTLLRLAPDEHVLTLTVHHIIADMWSADVLLRELMACYRGEELPDLPVQYADFATWQRSWLSGDVLEEQLGYWTGQLAGAPPFLEMPTDTPRPPVGTYAAGEESRVLPAELVKGIDQLCREQGTTRFMALLASFYTVLSRYSGEQDIVVGSPIANRTRAELENLIGFFVNTLVLRGDLSGDPTFAELLGRVRAMALGAYEHQDTPVEQLVEVLHPRRDPARSPLFQAMFTHQNGTLSRFELPGLAVSELAGGKAATEFDLTLELDDSGTEIHAHIQYNADIFAADSMRRLLGHWQTLLESIVADPHRPVSSLLILTEAERVQLVQEWNDTTRELPAALVHEQIEEQARRTPDATAVVFRDRQLSYAELDTAASALAARLLRLGVGQAAPVAVCVDRSPEMIIGLLGVLKAGAAYLPIDTTLPAERLAYMLDDAGVNVVVTTRTQRQRFPEQQTVLIDTSFVDEPQEPASVEGTDLAYVIYTSGSTGKPKGVMVQHAGVINFLAGMDEVLDPPENGVWLALTGVSFDIAVLELLWPLTHGWQVVLQDDGDVLPGARGFVPTKKLDFSLFYFAVSHDDDTTEDRYRLLLDGARFADQHGFSAVWTPERHFDAFGGLYPNPAMTSAALATITERVELRAGSVVLPLHDPIRVAEEWSMIDNLSKGRVSVSFASGWHADDFALAPGNFERRKEVMLEQIDTVRRLWRGESVKVGNGVGREIEVRTYPRPVQAELPFWLTAAGNPETFRQAGEAGAHLLTHLLGQSVDELETKIAVYREAWRAAGHQGEGQVALMVHTFVGTDVRETVRGPFREYLRRSFGLVRALAPSLGIDGEPTAEDVEALLDHAFEGYYNGSSLMGTVDECAAMAGRLQEIGVDEVACLIDFGIGSDDVLDSLPLLDEVRQRFDGPIGQDYSVAAQIERHDVTHVQCTPSLASILVADARTRTSLRGVDTFVVGGEALPPALASELIDVANVINMYGPTETTIWSTSSRVTSAEVTIGRPIANTQVYVVDESLGLVPAGVPGELCIGGDGLARGYLNRAGLTAERFPPSPFADGARLYRTGDRARYLPDGRIQFLGRVDRQVKLGGHRIELGEIESVLREHPAVRHAAVVVHDGALVAYLVGGTSRPSLVELRTLSLRKLPEVMAPGMVVWLDSLPLNASGKVDYKALPEPAAEERSERASVTLHQYVAPADEVERAIAGIWQDVLNVDSVGTRDNFFELGGHSLMAIQMVSRLRNSLGKDVTLRTVFESSTVAQLASRVRDAVAGRVEAPLVAVPRQGPLPLSFSQQRMWFFDQMNPGVAAYHLSAAFQLDGTLRLDALRLAFNEIVRRHEILRSTFPIVGEQPMQIAVAALDIPLPVVDLSGMDTERRQDEVVRLAVDESRVPFDLEADALLRTTILRLGPAEHVLLLTTHHIAADSWSIAVMAGELRRLYEAYCAGLPSPLPDLAIQYADFAVWQRDRLQGPLLDKQLAYWRDALADAPELMELPYDRPRPEAPTHDGAQISFQLSPEMSDGLKALSLTNDVTVFVTLLSVFSALLHRWAGQDHVVLGVPVAGRDLPELEPLIGFLGNATVVHNDLSGNPRFTDVLKHVRDTVIGAYDHQDLPVEKLVADLGVGRNAAYNPLFQVMFVYINDLVMAPSFGSLAVTPLDVHTGSVFMDLNLAMEDSPEGLRGTLDYSTELFDGATMDWLLANFTQLLAAVLAEPEVQLSSLMLSEPPVSETVGMVLSSTFTAGPVAEPVNYWLDQLALPVTIEFAPYNQVFQQLLQPSSEMARNEDGVNFALLRMADWGSSAGTVAAEFAQALAAFQTGRETPFVVVLCPAEGDAEWRELVSELVSDISQVVCLDMTDMAELYDIAEYHDPVSAEAGNIPYTPEFFAVLGTCVARQLASLVTEYPQVVVLDRPSDLVRSALRARGLDVLVWAGSSLSELDENCLFLSSSEEVCSVVRTNRPDVLVQVIPAAETEFLEHTWLLDPPGAPIPGVRWWEGR